MYLIFNSQYYGHNLYQEEIDVALEFFVDNYQKAMPGVLAFLAKASRFKANVFTRLPDLMY